MGLFGSSRRKPCKVFVAQHRRMPPVPILGETQTGLTRWHNPEFFRHAGGPSRHQHPYMQPRLGFYSGENLVASIRQKQGLNRSMSVDESLSRHLLHGGYPGPSERVVPCSPYQRHAVPGLGIAEERITRARPCLDCALLDGLEPPDSPFDRRYEHFIYPDHHEIDNHFFPSTGMPSLPRRPMSTFNPEFQPRHFNRGISRARGHPTFEWIRPFRSPRATNPYLAPALCRDTSLDYPRQWNALGRRSPDPYANSRHADRPPHASGSYERLRPPHLRQGSNRAEGRTEAGSERW